MEGTDNATQTDTPFDPVAIVAVALLTQPRMPHGSGHLKLSRTISTSNDNTICSTSSRRFRIRNAIAWSDYVAFRIC